MNQGAFHEACNIASLWSLPIIFFVENNQYAVATPTKDASAAAELAHVAVSYDMPSRQVFGYDVAAIHSVVGEAAASLRAGGKPWLIEAKCYRHFHHGGDLEGSQYGYREKSEENTWLAKDAITNFPKHLESERVLDERGLKRVQESAERVDHEAVNRCTTGEEPARVRPELWPKPSPTAFAVPA